MSTHIRSVDVQYKYKTNSVEEIIIFSTNHAETTRQPYRMKETWPLSTSSIENSYKYITDVNIIANFLKKAQKNTLPF